jgi:transposase-like protein
MVRKKKSHSVELKKQIAQAVLSGSARVMDLSREHGVHPSLINKWVRLVREGKPLRSYGDGSGIGNGRESYVATDSEREVMRLQAELARYKQKVGEQAMAIDFLKKAIEDAEQRRRRSAGSVVTGASWDPSKKRVK